MKDTEGEDVINGMHRVMGKCGRWELPVQEEEATHQLLDLAKSSCLVILTRVVSIAVINGGRGLKRWRDREEEEGELTVCSELIPGFSFPLVFICALDKIRYIRKFNFAVGLKLF